MAEHAFPPKMHRYVTTMADETFALMERLGEEGTFDLIPTLGPLVMHIAAHAFLGDDFRQRPGSPLSGSALMTDGFRGWL